MDGAAESFRKKESLLCQAEAEGQGWTAKILEVEVSCRGFVANSSTGLLKEVGIRGVGIRGQAHRG